MKGLTLAIPFLLIAIIISAFFEEKPVTDAYKKSDIITDSYNYCMVIMDRKPFIDRFIYCKEWSEGYYHD